MLKTTFAFKQFEFVDAMMMMTMMIMLMIMMMMMIRYAVVTGQDLHNCPLLYLFLLFRNNLMEHVDKKGKISSLIFISG